MTRLTSEMALREMSQRYMRPHMDTMIIRIVTPTNNADTMSRPRNEASTDLPWKHVSKKIYPNDSWKRFNERKEKEQTKLTCFFFKNFNFLIWNKKYMALKLFYIDIFCILLIQINPIWENWIIKEKFLLRWES